jgi:LysR family transcriptional regulator, positive regulator for ilvC
MEDLQLTLAAIDQPTFADVARQRHVSQSTVSRAVQRVEAELGLELFAREGRVAEARSDPQTVAAVDQLRTVCALWGDLTAVRIAPRKSLSIFCTVTASQAIVPELLATFRRTYPDVHLELRTGPASDAIDAVLRSDVDAAIAPLPRSLPRSLVSLPVAEMPLCAVIANDHSLPPSDWKGTHVIVPRPGVTRNMIDQWCRTNLRHGFTTQECDGHEEVIALTALGSGVGIVPSLVVESSALVHRLIFAPTPAPLPTMRIALCARRRTTTAAPLQQLWQMLEAEQQH